MPYKLPENIVPETTLNLCVPIPNEPEYIQAFLASYSHLARWVAWERDGTQNASLAASVWMAAYNQLLDNWQDCQEGEGEEMTTTIVNNYVSCSPCGTGEPTTIYCVMKDGTVQPSPQPYVNPVPQPPPGLEYPINPIADSPPYELNTWEEFDESFCLAANALWYSASTFVTAAKSLGVVFAVGATLLTLIVPLLPASWLAAIGGVTLLGLVEQLTTILASTQAVDILDALDDWLDDEREEITCWIYSHRYDMRGVPSGLMIAAADYIEDSLSMSPVERNAVENFVVELFSYYVIAGVIASEFVMDEPATLVDCAACGGESGIYFQNIGATQMLEDGEIVEGTSPGVYEGTMLKYGAIYTIESQAGGGYPWYGQHGASFSLWAADSAPTDTIIQILAVSNYVAPTAPYPSGYPTEGYKVRLAAQSNLYAWYGQLFDGLEPSLGNNDAATGYQFAGAANAENFVITFRFWPGGGE